MLESTPAQYDNGKYGGSGKASNKTCLVPDRTMNFITGCHNHVEHFVIIQTYFGLLWFVVSIMIIIITIKCNTAVNAMRLSKGDIFTW